MGGGGEEAAKQLLQAQLIMDQQSCHDTVITATALIRNKEDDVGKGVNRVQSVHDASRELEDKPFAACNL